MKNTIILLLTLAMAIGAAPAADGQEDSAALDAGYLPLQRAQTQTVRIAGLDLEKMPFANLSDAIAAWLYGAYTRPLTLLYVVDGSPVADINAYSVWDIEEAILVENAAAMLYTGGGQQEVVLIRTRRGKERRAVTAAAQTGLVSGGTRGIKTDTRWYHQYYLGGNINTGTWRFGASVNWLRDVEPTSGQYQIVTPDHLQRWRIHGYADWQPDKHNHLELALGYAPQKFQLATDSSEQQLYTTAARNSASQRFFLPELRWRGEWLGGLINEFQASYVQSVYRDTGLMRSAPDTNTAYYSAFGYHVDRSSYHVYVRDRLAYRLEAGGWRFEPAMNISYEHVDEWLGYGTLQSEPYGPGNTPYYTSSGGDAYSRYHVLFYTPQLDIHYKRAVDLTLGETAEAGFNTFPGVKKSFFFVSGSIDVLRLSDEKSSSGLAFYGSYAQRATPPVPGYALSDLKNGYANHNSYGGNGLSFAGYENFYYTVALPTKQYWVWEAGLRYSTPKDRLQIRANIERRNYSVLENYYGPSYLNGGTIYQNDLTASDILLHLDIRARILQTAGADWQSGISSIILHSKVSGLTTVQEDGGLVGYMGDVYPNPYSITGAWVNRVRIDHFIGGLDLLYHFGETAFETAPGYFPVATRRQNPVAVPNLYAGFRFSRARSVFDIFVESRGLFRTNPSDLQETRRYYTVGGKLSI